MKVIISGASGLVGMALTNALRSQGRIVMHLVRSTKRATGTAAQHKILWDPTSARVDVPALESADAVVHLSGASISDGRWTEVRKQILRSSRLDTTRILVDSLARLSRKPAVFVCASAIGYYGDRGNEILTEASVGGTDFLALLARDWEAEAVRAQTSAGIRTVILRFGVILSNEGGALPRIAAPFKFFVGGPLGSGQQWLSWLTLQDAIEVIQFAIANGDLAGPINAVSPNPVRNAEFAKTLGQVLHRPAIFAVPAFALRIALGEMADALLLASQRVTPEALLHAKYGFRYPDIQDALRALFGMP